MSLPPNHRAESSSSSSYSPPLCSEFTLPEIKLATRNFDESSLLGSGGFAKVYKGTITYGERLLDVAIKRLTLRSVSSEEAFNFRYEIKMLYKLRHPHLVSQIGYCSDEQEMIFVYEYLPHGTLEDHLHKGGLPLNWVRRLKICLETALGLEYLHTKTDTKSMVLHLDVKSSNILLASTWVAKLSDFGLSKVRPADSGYLTDHVGGTLGYLDPEFQQNGKASRKTDVYAFGVVMFEVLCRRKAYSYIDGVRQFLRTWAKESIRKGRLKQIIDPDLEWRISPKCLKKFVVLAKSCLHSRPKQRPSMRDVVKDLKSILTLQEEAGKMLPIKLFPAEASNEEYSVGTESLTLKSLDRILYTVGGEDHIIHRFNYNTILQATENFSESNKILDEGYNSMYKGRLQNGHAITVAKCMNDHLKKCLNDASILVKLEHGNIIQLLGYCVGETNLYILYDFASNATLANFLFDPTCDVLEWNKRYKIILGVARGLVYLHNHAPTPIIHVDVKPENILLDGNFEPRLSGFGFAKEIYGIFGATVDGLFYGTVGYAAPEIFRANWVTTKSDVYSFGVLILNAVTGHEAMHKTRLTNYVWEKRKEGKLLDIIDPRIKHADSTVLIKFTNIGLWCTRDNEEDVMGSLQKRTQVTSDSLQYNMYEEDCRNVSLMGGMSVVRWDKGVPTITCRNEMIGLI